MRQGQPTSHIKLHSDWILGQSLDLGGKQGACALAAMWMPNSEGQWPTEELGSGSEVIGIFTLKENGVVKRAGEQSGTERH